MANRPDHLSRCLRITLGSIPDKDRRTIDEINAEFKRRHPRILGGLRNAVVAALANRNHVPTAGLPRMADFAAWVIAAESALPWSQGEFMRHYETNRKDAETGALGANPVTPFLLQLVERFRQQQDQSGMTSMLDANKTVVFLGTAANLLEQLRTMLTFDNGRRVEPNHWPQAANKLTPHLERLKPALRNQGVLLETKRTNYRPRGRHPSGVGGDATGQDDDAGDGGNQPPSPA